MLSFASDFWPLFWAFIGIGAAVTVLMCVAVAAIRPAWFKRSQPASVHHLPQHHLQLGHAPEAHTRKVA